MKLKDQYKNSKIKANQIKRRGELYHAMLLIVLYSFAIYVLIELYNKKLYWFLFFKMVVILLFTIYVFAIYKKNFDMLFKGHLISCFKCPECKSDIFIEDF